MQRRIPRTASTLLALAALLASACGTGETPAPPPASPLPATQALPPPDIAEVPAGPGSLAPRVTRIPDGGALLSWLEPEATGTALRWSALADSAWSAPQTIVSSPNLLLNAADVPGIGALGNGRLVAHWRETREPAGAGYDAKVALSFDSGRTWEKAVTPHRDHADAEHGFVAVFEASPPFENGGRERTNSRPQGASGSSTEAFDLTGSSSNGASANGNALKDRDVTEIDAGIAWIDGREAATSPQAFSSQLIVTTLESGGDVGLGLEQVLDPRTCECCPLASARAGDVTLLAYRDRSEDDHRDIAVMRRAPDGNWSGPVRVHDDAWQVMGCPVNGPAIDADGSRVAIAWFTASLQDPRVLLSFSDDAGSTWSDPVRVDSPAAGQAAGHAGIALLEDGSVLVTHVVRQDGRLVVIANRVVQGSPPGPGSTIARDVVGIPQLARAGDRVHLAWAERVPPPEGTPPDAPAPDARRLRSASWSAKALIGKT